MPDLTPTQRRRFVAEVIAYAFRDGVWVANRMAERAAHDLDIESGRWLMKIAQRATASFAVAPIEEPRGFNRWVEAQLVSTTEPSMKVVTDWIERRSPTTGRVWAGPPERMIPQEMGERRWPVPVIDTPADLATFLNLDLTELLWYADPKMLERSTTDENLRHYSYYWRKKKRGGARLVEAPKQNLKYLQRKILREIIDHIPAHDAAHGFRRGRSIQTYAVGHTGRDVVLRFDLRDFFTNVPTGRVFGTFFTAGYPTEVAHLLRALTTNATPPAVLRQRPQRYLGAANDEVLRGAHLPQGAPTSPALANLAAYRLDVRMRALADRFDARYTRYADDLVVSGDHELAEVTRRFMWLAEEIVADEGFALNTKKTDVRRSHQRQVVAGMVVNDHLNIHRRDYDQLKAVLHDAKVNGAARANRSGHPQFRAHLEGRIGFVQATNPKRARKLWALFDAIAWA